MFLSKQYFDLGIPPEGFQSLPTSKAMGSYFITFSDPAIPFLTPVGSILLRNIEKILLKNAQKNGIDEVKIPMLMKTDLLKEGAAIGDLFSSKIIHLSGSMSDFHLMTSPEMMLVDMFARNIKQYPRLPIHYCYATDYFRNMRDPKGLFRSKQIRVFSGTSIDKTEKDQTETLERIQAVISGGFHELGIPYHREDGGSGFVSEYHYMNSKETEGNRIPSICPDKKVRSLALGMVDKYNPATDMKRFSKIDGDGSIHKPIISSWALGTLRIMYTVLDHYRDHLGFNLPESIRPIDIVLLPRYDSLPTAKRLASYLEEAGYSVAVDDFVNGQPEKRRNNAHFLGAGYSVFISPKRIAAANRAGEMLLDNQNEQELINFFVSMKLTSANKKFNQIVAGFSNETRSSESTLKGPE